MSNKRRQQPEPVQELLHKLEAHQIEPEQENEARQSATQNLQAANEQFHTFYELSTAGFFTIDETGIICALNSAGARFLGGDRSDLLTRILPEFLAADTLPVFMTFLGRVFTSHVRESCDVRFTLHDEASRYAHIEGIVPSGQHECCLIVVDSSDLINAQEALGKIEYEKQLILQSALEGFWIVSVEGRFLDVNDAYCALTGYTRDEMLTMSIPDIDAVDTDDDVHVRMHRILSSGAERFVSRHRCKDGSIIVVQVSVKHAAELGRTFVYIHDITERKQFEQALQESEDRYRSLVETSPDGVLLHKDGMILYANSAALAMYGATSLESLQHRTLLELVHDEDRAALMRRMLHAPVGTHLPLQETRIRRADGRILYVELVGCRINYKDGYANQIIVHDITSRKHREDELQRLNRTYRALSSSSHAMMRAVDEYVLMKDVCRIIVDVCSYAMVWIGFAEDDARKSVRPVMYSGFEDGYLDTLQLTWANTERGQGPTGRAIRTGTTCFCRDFVNDPAFHPWRDEAIRRGYASSIAIPIRDMNKVFGALTIYSPIVDGFSNDEVILLNELSSDLAYGITAIRLRAAHAKAVESLTLLEDRYHSLFNGMTEGFALYEIVCRDNGDPCDCRFLDINPAFERMIGLRRYEVVGRTRHEMLPDDTLDLLSLYRDVVRMGMPSKLQHHSTDLRRWYDVMAYRPAKNQLAVIYTDITIRRQMEEEIRHSHAVLEEKVKERTLALSKSEERYRNTLDSLIEGCMIIDCGWTYLYVNDAIARQMYRTKESFIGRTLMEVDPGIEAREVFARFQTCMNDRLPQEFVTDVALDDGSTQWFELRCVPVQEGIFVVSADITERMRSELTLRQYNQQLQGLSQRLIEAQEAERRRIAYELHDEVGQLLTAVQMNLRGIKEMEDEHEIPLRLDESIALTERLHQQVRDLSVDLRPWMLDQLGLIPSVRWYIDKQAQRSKLTMEFSADEIHGRFTPVLEITAYRVIQESVTNILRHAQATRVNVRMSRTDTALVTEIIDNGIGFTMDAMNDRPIGSRGLGMVGMKERVASLGGLLKIESEPGKGTAIWFRLPLHDFHTTSPT